MSARTNSNNAAAFCNDPAMRFQPALAPFESNIIVALICEWHGRSRRTTASAYLPDQTRAELQIRARFSCQT